MSYPVRADHDQAVLLATKRGLPAEVINDLSALSAAVRDVLIKEKGYPLNTTVEINGMNQMAMVLSVEEDGSWELV